MSIRTCLIFVVLCSLATLLAYQTVLWKGVGEEESATDEPTDYAVYTVDELRALPVDAKRITLYGLGDGALKEIPRFSSLEFLYIPNGVHLTDDGLAHIIKLSKLRQLLLPNCPKLSDSSATTISQLVGLELLDIRDVRFSDKSVSELLKLTHLIEIRISGNTISAAGLKSIAAMESIRRIAIVKAKNCDLGFLAAVAEKKGIEALVLQDLEITPEDALGALSKCPDLLQLDVRSHKEPVKRAPDQMTAFKKLEELYIEWPGILQQWVLGYIASHTTLKAVTVKGRVENWEVAGNALQYLKRLETITTIGVEVDDKWIASMSGVESLREIAISGSSKVTKKGIGEFVSARHPCAVRIHKCEAISKADCEALAKIFPDSSIEWAEAGFDD